MKHIILFCCFWCTASTLLAQYPIGETNVAFNDAGRTINTEICYPALAAGTNTTVAAGQFPLVVFGHGFQLSPSDYDWVKEVLVPKGYIVLMPSFSLNIFSPDHVRLGEDVAFIIDEMYTTPPALLVGAIELRTAVMGHSMGGGVTYHAAASNPNVTTTVTLAAESDTSPTAVTVVAPNVSVPSLVIGASNDCVSPNAADQIPIYNALGASYKTYIEITGGSHCQFTDGSFTCSLGEFGCSTSISQTAQQASALPLFCNWLDYYLKDDCDAFLDFITATGDPAYEDLMETSSTRPFDTPSIDDTAMPTLTASAIGGTYTYQWYLDGNIIPGATATTYTATTNGNYTIELTNNMPCVASSQIVLVNSFVPQVGARIKLFLQGPYNGADMNTDLTTAMLLPTSEPYTALGFTVSNTAASLGTAVNSLTGDDAIVDWVLIEARSTTTTIAEAVVALVQKDGDVVQVDGFSPVVFPSLSAGMYHVVARHRNHLGVMTLNTLLLSAN